MTNVIAKLHWPTDQLVTKLTDSDEFSILINAHYDSIPGSPGASDDGIGVACMLEVIRAMSKGAAMRRPIIFLFNGTYDLYTEAITSPHDMHACIYTYRCRRVQPPGCPRLHHAASLREVPQVRGQSGVHRSRGQRAGVPVQLWLVDALLRPPGAASTRICHR